MTTIDTIREMTCDMVQMMRDEGVTEFSPVRVSAKGKMLIVRVGDYGLEAWLGSASFQTAKAAVIAEIEASNA